jgi:hypothetical protein
MVRFVVKVSLPSCTTFFILYPNVDNTVVLTIACIASVIRGHNEDWAISINRGLAGGHIDGVGEIHRHALPFVV